MKKIIGVFLILFLIVGCNDINNTPTKKVEELLNKYQSLDDDLLNNLDYSIESNNLTEEQKNSYRDIMKKQYKDLTYTIKDEKIDGDDALVTVEIEVYDFNKANVESTEYFTNNQNYFLNEEGIVDEGKYTDYKLKLMDEIKDRVKYTIDFNVKKKDKVWVIEEISDEARQKIHGLYSY